MAVVTCARFLVIASLVIAHFALFDARAFTTDTNPFLYQLRFRLLFASSVVVFSVQFVREEAVRECHRRCEKLPPVAVSPTIFLRFGLSFSHFLTYQLFYPTAILQNVFYSLYLFSLVQLPSIQFGYLMSSIRKGITAGNRKLHLFLGKGDLQHLFTEKSLEKEISRIHRDSMILKDLAEYVISTYSLQLVVTLAVLSLEILFILQITFFDILRGINVLGSSLDVIVRGCLLLSYLYNLYDVIFPGVNYPEECTRTDVILSYRSGEHSQLREFIMQRMLEGTEVSILGLFRLDYHLLYAIICGAINYGLIIGMFHLAGLKKQEGLSS